MTHFFQDNYITLILILVLNIFIIKNNKYINIFKIYDIPDENRKFHKHKTPIIGGNILFLNIIFYFLFDNFFLNINDNFNLYFVHSLKTFYSFYLCLTAIFFIGLYDDKFNLKANTKIMISCFLILSAILIDSHLVLTEIKLSLLDKTYNLGLFGYFFSIVCILTLINTLNMIDGIDLQAGLYLLYLLMILFFLNQSLIIIFLLLAILSFLYLNFLNKSFLGDSGIYFIAYIISYLLIKNYNINKNIFVDHIVIIFIIPFLDLIRTSIHRLSLGKNPFLADNNHIHHLLMTRFKNYTFLADLIIFLLPGLLFFFLSAINKYNIFTFSFLILFSTCFYLFMIFRFGKKMIFSKKK